MKQTINHANQTIVTGGALQMIQSVYKQLRKSEKAVADYITENPEKVINSNISEIAKESNVSEATVIRFCKTAGFSGFQDLKVTLARGAAHFDSPTIYENIKKGDSLSTALEKMYANNMQALNGTYQCLDLNQLQEVSKVVSQARFVYLIGVGTSGLVAEYAEYRFTRIGLTTRAYTESHQIALATTSVRKSDVVIAISQSGSTKAIVEPLEIAKGKGAITIAITGHPYSPIAKISNYVLRNTVHEAPFDSGGMPSLMAQLSVVDGLMAGASLESFDTSIQMIQETAEALKSKKY
ncbi:MurR/RpiR family transcriptional regulator [Cohnella silvisoli]|uniref:MurR/RpiR family transcriptional regulator n=1 Tax=Cohnella silvisoli TaxID=2873699 RepID=A0ABV1KRJ6_9BACL|nr:MurR/RpiR family transcriptional regulator [Cohnella silvisoli]MCD9022424.1 MurR/RpiR family transcriptional regulator [Cohnella silvisoli]